MVWLFYGLQNVGDLGNFFSYVTKELSCITLGFVLAFWNISVS